MQFNVITLFPEVFEPYVTTSVIGRGKKSGALDINLVQLRDFATDKHHTVDDTPYGGGAGMVLKIEPIAKAIDSIKTQNAKLKMQNSRTVVLSARGQQFTQAKAAEYAGLDSLTLICGRYEGIDQRVADHLADEELSIGPYVLAGGELAALVVLEAVGRLIPGVLGNPESLQEESFATNSNIESRNSKQIQNTNAQNTGPVSDFDIRASNFPAQQVEYPQYTKPADYNGWTVPEVLLSGDHAAIEQWRRQQRKP